MLFDPHISLVSQLVREGIAVFSLRKETQRGCDLLKDHARGSDRVLPETADWSLPSQKSPGGTCRAGGSPDLGFRAQRLRVALSQSKKLQCPT